MAGDGARAFCPTCGGELLDRSRFCGRCGTPQTMSAQMGAAPPPPPPSYAPPHPGHPPPYAYAPPAPRQAGSGWKTALVIVLVVGVLAGGAVAGIMFARRGPEVSRLLCPAGVCPRFPVDRATRLEVTDSAFGKVRLFVPAGALREPTELTVRPAAADARPPRVVDPSSAAGVEPIVVGPVIELGPDGQTFEQPLRLQLPFEPDKLPPGGDVAIVTWDDGGRVERLPPLSFDADDGLVEAEVRHFSRAVAVIDPGPQVRFVPPPPPPPPPCPPVTLRAEKCPWTPDGYSVGECPPGFCWDGGPQGFLACKQRDVAPGIAVGENRNPYCATGVPRVDRCTGELLACDPPPPAP